MQSANLRTGVSGTIFEIAQFDTVEYTVTVANYGNETASGAVIADTSVFDTSVHAPVAFVWIETSTADSWAYTLDGINWETWGLAPPAAGADIKGLKWLINTLGINEIKAIRFRVKIK